MAIVRPNIFQNTNRRICGTTLTDMEASTVEELQHAENYQARLEVLIEREAQAGAPTNENIGRCGN